MSETKPFVIYPHNENEEPQPNLTPKDKLIYVALRRYMDKSSMEAFPSYARITKDTGAAAKTIKNSVDKLVNEGYLKTRKDGRKIVYIFNNKKKFEPYSWDFLDRQDLSFTEKSYLVASQQYMYKDENTETGKISYTNKELSKIIKMPESTISRVNHSLETKGFLEGASLPTKSFDLRKLDQIFIWKLKEQDEKIAQNTKDINNNKERIIQLEKALNKLIPYTKKLAEENKQLKESGKFIVTID